MPGGRFIIASYFVGGDFYRREGIYGNKENTIHQRVRIRRTPR